jgi:opacity protein-like surface antigen
MKSWILFVVISMLSLFLAPCADAQVRKKTTTTAKKNQEKEATDATSGFMDKFNPEIKFGNLGFFNGFSLSTKLTAGYRLSNHFTAGLGGKLFFDQRVIVGAPNPSILDLGPLMFARGKITDNIYLQAEYAFMNYGKDPVGYTTRRYLTQNVSLNYPLIGVGYLSGTGKWKFGVELMYIANERARDYQNSIVEYWFGASYNF